jgi:peptide/nickel transport system ATP-binding protein
MNATSGALLDVSHLKMHFQLPSGWVRAVDDISFSLGRGETIGLVGESGCGKTSAALSVMNLLPDNGHIRDGQVVFDGQDISHFTDEQMRRIRWRRIAIIFQGAMNALNPVYRVGDQLMDALMLHDRAITRKQARQRVADLFSQVGIEPSRMDHYPHEYSGGMKQRAMIAMALLCNPDLIICDEPTTALDVVIQDQIIEKLKELQKEHQQGMIIISHDISVIAETCDKIAVMYGGKIIEYGRTADVFQRPSHPYTVGLLRSFPSIRGEIRALVTIPGDPPDLITPPPGCRFADRCPVALDVCRQNAEPPAREIPYDQTPSANVAHLCFCHRGGELEPDQIDFQGGRWA